MQRLKLHCGKPFALENSFVPGALFTDFYQIDFNNIGLYDYMESKGHNLENYQVYQQIETLMPEEAKLLNVAEDSYVIKSCYSSADQNQQIIEYTESYVKANKGIIQYHLNFK